MHHSLRDPDGVTYQCFMPLAEHQLANVPEITRTRVKHLILDGSACALHRTRGVLWSIKKRNGQTETVDARSSGQDKSLKRSPKQCGFADYLVHRMTDCAPRLGPLPAAPLNGTFIQIFKLNDYHGGAPAHSVDVVLPFSFAAAQQLSSHGRSATPRSAFLLTAVTGFKIGPRECLGPHGLDIFTRGID